MRRRELTIGLLLAAAARSTRAQESAKPHRIAIVRPARRMADDVHQILNGTKPGEIPIYQSSKFDFVINLKAAEALGLTIPPSLLALADEVIE
jgi:hypothetical protein